MTEHEKKLKHGGRNNIKYRKLAFDKYKLGKNCNTCLTEEDLCVHHKNENFLDNTKENLEILCRSCHISLHNKGKKITQEHKDKISKNNTNRGKSGKDNHTSRGVQQQDNIGNILGIYGSILEAERKTGINNGNICRACKNNGTAGGYKWTYNFKPPKDEGTY